MNASAAFRDRDDARSTLSHLSHDTAAAKVRETTADAALTRTQAANVKTFERAAPRIAELATAKPTGKPNEDAAAVDADSRAPWEAFR